MGVRGSWVGWAVTALVAAGCGPRYEAYAFWEVKVVERGEVKRMRALEIHDRARLIAPAAPPVGRLVERVPDLSSQRELGRLVKDAPVSRRSGELRRLGGVLNPGVHPDYERWVIGNDPLVVGIGERLPEKDYRPYLRPHAAKFVTDAEAGRAVWAVLVYPAELDLGRVLKVLRESPNGTEAVGGYAVMYTLAEGRAVGEVQEVFAREGVLGLRRVSGPGMFVPVMVVNWGGK